MSKYLVIGKEQVSGCLSIEPYYDKDSADSRRSELFNAYNDVVVLSEEDVRLIQSILIRFLLGDKVGESVGCDRETPTWDL